MQAAVPAWAVEWLRSAVLKGGPWVRLGVHYLRRPTLPRMIAAARTSAAVVCLNGGGGICYSGEAEGGDGETKADHPYGWSETMVFTALFAAA